MANFRRDSIDHIDRYCKSALLGSVENMHMRMVGVVDAGRSGGDFGLMHCVSRFLKTSLLAHCDLSRKKRQHHYFFIPRRQFPADSWRSFIKSCAVGGVALRRDVYICSHLFPRLSLVLAVDTCRAERNARHQSSGLNRYI